MSLIPINPIFLETYWGSFKPEDRTHTKDILINRNRFIEEYKPTSAMKRGSIIKSRRHGVCDHPEVYRRGNEVIIVASPYTDDKKDVDHLAQSGMTMIYPLYHQKATTFIIEFPGLKEARAWYKTWIEG